MTKKLVVSASLLAKSQVAAYTRKDGTVVQAHDNGRQAAAPEPVNQKVLAKLKTSHHMDARALKSSLGSSLSSGDTEGHDGKPMTYGDVKGHLNTMRMQLGSKPEHAEHLKHAQYALNQSFGLNHAPVSEKHAKLIGAALSGKTRMDDNGVVQHAGGAAAPKPAAPAVRTRNESNGFHGEAYSHFLRKKHGPDNYMNAASEQDHIDAKAHAGKKFSEAAHSLVQAGHFGNHDEARDYLDSTSGRHLHNEVGDGDVSKVGWVAKDVKNKKTVQAHHEGQAAAGKSKQQAQAASRKNPGGYQPPQPGDTGHDEHTKYGVYFRKGDKVKDAWGDHHEVISHNGAEVLTNHGTLHPTKLSHADAPAAGAGAKKLAVRAQVAKQAAAKTGSAAPAKMKNVGTDKWPLHAKSSDALGAKHPDGSTHHVGGFEPPVHGKGDHLIHHDGKTFSYSGKSGKNMKTGEASYEYRAGDSGEHRAWVTHSGHLMND